MKSRIAFLFAILTLLWSIMILRSVQLQLLPDSRLRSLQTKQFQSIIDVQSRRGAILDRKGRDLAISLTAYSLFADPSVINQPKKLAKKLATELNLSKKSILEKLQSKERRFVWIARKLNENTADRIKKWDQHGLGFVVEYERVYPNDTLLAHTLGMVGADGRGLEGLELQFDHMLAGKDARFTVRRDARGRPLLAGSLIAADQSDGQDVTLTVDADIQHVLELELSRAIQEFDADAAYGVILNAKTSAIVALATAPTFDANQAAKINPSLRRNKPVTDTFEPGSTLKTFTVASALNQELIAPNTKYDTEWGKMKIGRRVVREADQNHRWGQLSVSEILALSSNIGSTKIAFDLGAESLRQYLRLFGFGEKLGVDLPGEARGMLLELPWHEHLLANISFGHGISATPLQVANAYAAIANGGVLRRPFIVQSSEENEVHRVMSEVEAGNLRLLLAGVTAPNGTGVNAKVDGFSVGGKTGTAQKVNSDGKGYLPGAYISSFAGFIPVHDPQFVIYVAVDHPKKNSFYGAQVAAPIFSRVASYAVRSEGLPPTLLSEKNLVPRSVKKNGVAKNTQENATHQIRNDVTPNLSQLTLREVIQSLNGLDIELKIHGEGVVTRTNPNSGDPLGDDRVIEVYLE